MAPVEARLAALQAFLKAHSATETTFIIKGGAEYNVRQDPFDYLQKYGAYTHDGRRIVLYPHSVEGVDPLSLSLYQMLDEAIEHGRLELPEPESDEIGGKSLE